MEKDKQITVIAAAQFILLLAWGFTDFVNNTRAITGTVFLIGGYSVFYFIQYKELDDLRSTVQKQAQPNTLSMDQIREVTKTWSDKEYRGNITVNWNFADYSTKPLHDWVNGNDELYAITGAISGRRESVQLFILASEKDVKEHKKVRHPDQYRRPYKYSDYYQEYRRQSKNKVMKETGHQPQQNYVRRGMPAIPQNQLPSQNPDNTAEESEDE